MHELTKRLALIGLVAILGGCNSTDALTPQVDVGGSFNSPPVTQSDLDRMSAEQTPAAPRQSAFTETGDTGSPAANTLQAQADALARDASRQQPAGGEAARVAVEEPAQAQETAAAAPAQSAGSVRFLPIIGAPVQAVTPLSRRLASEAGASGITIKSSSDNSSQHILKGYFSATADKGKTTVIYVWDVLDPGGARLHRIQGQETVEGQAGDPWATVPARTMEDIASTTIRQYLEWRDGARG